MKILIICESLNKSPAGNVFKTFIKEMKLHIGVEFFVIANKIDSELKTSNDFRELNLVPITNSRFYKLVFVLSNFDFEGLQHVKAGKLLFNRVYDEFKPDVILLFASAYGFFTLELGYQLSRDKNIPLAIHLVDPMPSVEGWNEHPILRRAIRKYAGKRLRGAQFLSYTNKKMLDYQTHLHKIPKSTVTEVLYNPVQHFPATLKMESENNKFLYIGSLYNKRKPNELISAFTRFLLVNDKAELLFVGSDNNFQHLIPEKFVDNIKFISWTDKPEEYLDAADILIDIDADITNDVFISSKLNNYLMYDKLILSISPDNSPARDLLKMCNKSVFFSTHSSDSIFKKLIEIRDLTFSADFFNERVNLRLDLLSKNIVKKLIDSLKKIIN